MLQIKYQKELNNEEQTSKQTVRQIYENRVCIENGCS